MSVEEHEEIPWSMLVEHERRGRSRTLYIAAALILAAVVGFTGIRWFNDHRHGEAAAIPPAAVATTLPLPSTTAAPLPSEADLMAIDPAVTTLAAAARAEWFVTDYFTVDGSPAPDLLDALVDDAVVPELPHAAADGRSFVEWARAYSMRPYPEGLVVTVLFRTLYENQEQRIARAPVRAVDVMIVVDDQRTAVAGLPIPVDPPSAAGIIGWIDATAQEPLDDPSGVPFPVADHSDTVP